MTDDPSTGTAAPPSRRLRWRLRQRRWAQRLRRALLRDLEAQTRATLEAELRRTLAAQQALGTGGGPLPPLEDVEFRVYSQNGEDGILLYLLALAGWERKRFLEIGIEDGSECNCAMLARHLGWDGWFVEGDPDHAALARQHFGWDPAAGKRAVHVLSSYVTRETVNGLLAEHGIAGIDLLSIDIDGMDWWIWQALAGLSPRVVTVEYNAAFGPERSLTVPYRARFDRWAAHPSGLYYGASLAALEALGREQGYRLVGCNSEGVSAFFLREDVAPPGLRAVPAAEAFRENAYQNRGTPYARQFATIEHLPFETV